MRPAGKAPALALFDGQLNPTISETVCTGTASRHSKVLLIDHDGPHAQRLIEDLCGRGLSVELCGAVPQATIRLKRPDAEYELVIVNVSDASQGWLRALHTLDEASRRPGLAAGPRFLCVSTVNHGPHFRFQVEQIGGRFVYER